MYRSIIEEGGKLGADFEGPCELLQAAGSCGCPFCRKFARNVHSERCAGHNLLDPSYKRTDLYFKGVVSADWIGRGGNI